MPQKTRRPPEGGAATPPHKGCVINREQKPRSGSLQSASRAPRVTLGAPNPRRASVSLPTWRKEVLRPGERMPPHKRSPYFRQPRALRDRGGREPKPEKRGSARGGRPPTPVQAERPSALHARTALTRRLHPAQPNLTWSWGCLPDASADALGQGCADSSRS